MRAVARWPWDQNISSKGPVIGVRDLSLTCRGRSLSMKVGGFQEYAQQLMYYSEGVGIQVQNK